MGNEPRPEDEQKYDKDLLAVYLIVLSPGLVVFALMALAWFWGVL